MRVRVTPLDPFIARDSRPFGSGNKARTLGWPYPSVIAGSLRSMLGKLSGGFTNERVQELKEVQVRGPFPCSGEEVYFPRPLDILVREKTLYPVRPVPQESFPSGSGTDLPEGVGLAMPEGVGDEDFKPSPVPAFWSYEKILAWLFKTEGLLSTPDGNSTWGKGFMPGLKQEDRVHVGIDPQTGASEEGMIFSTSGLDFVGGNPREGYIDLGMALDVRTENKDFRSILSTLDELHPAGGERRLSRWQSTEGEDRAPWICPSTLRNVLQASGGLVRMMLVSPAVFSDGWRPGWLHRKESGQETCWEGTPPGLSSGSGLKLRLVSAVTGRWVPVSGWLIEKGKTSGPKPLRRMVPAGSVYFFEVTGGDPLELEKLWLQSVCDDRQDRLDGFGLSLWGSWTWNNDFLTR
jgi:CRISPR-associated protein Cmr3